MHERVLWLHCNYCNYYGFSWPPAAIFAQVACWLFNVDANYTAFLSMDFVKFNNKKCLIIWCSVVSLHSAHSVSVLLLFLYIVAIGCYISTGAPALSFLASTSSSLTIEVHLSPEGVPPILSIAVNFTNPPGLVRSVPGPFTPGQMVTTTLSDLEADTEHNFTVFALNFNGISPASPDTSFRTGM